MLRTILKCGGKTRAYCADVVPVQSGLSISPSEMHQLQERNIPISSSTISDDLISPGHKGTDASVPLFRQRGVDFSDVYVSESNARSKISDAVKTAPVVETHND